MQGVKWIKSKYGSELRVIRLGHKHYLDKIEKAVTDGATLLIENIGETIDPVLDNLLGRNLIRKGKLVFVFFNVDLSFNIFPPRKYRRK